MKKAFTLAEVLITLAIIGVVAALTIPTLVANYQQRGWNTAATVFERKLEESLKVMNTQGTLAGYKTTEEFVSELQKHLKITKICKNDDLTSCFEDKITWNIIDISAKTESEEIDISSVKTASDLGQSNWDTNTVGIQLNNGTSAVLAYNPDCRQDQYSNQITGTSCIAMIYDTSGYAKPNTTSKDVRGINSSLNRCAFKSNSACFGMPFRAPLMTLVECSDGNTALPPDNTGVPAGKEASALGINKCMYNNDYWAGAVKACGGVDKMPTMDQLGEIGNYIYNRDGMQGTYNYSGLKMDEEKAASLGIQPNMSIFSSYENPKVAYSTWFRNFSRNSSSYSNSRDANIHALCIY